MKVTIRITAYRFAGLLLINLILLSRLSYCSEKSEEDSTSLSRIKLFEDFNSERFYSHVNIASDFKNDKMYFIVLLTNRTCFECLKTINYFGNELTKLYQLNYVVLSQIDSSTLDRKRSLSNMKQMFNYSADYYFQYKEQTTETIFQKLSVLYSPAIILMKNNKAIYFPYRGLFDESINVTEEIQKEISDFLKK